MKKLVMLVLVLFVAVACGGGGDDVESRLIGKWSGAQTNPQGDKIPATWEFLEGGTMVVTVVPLDITYGAEWSVDGNRINIATELDPENPTYRDVEFVSDDVIRLTKGDTVETWTRVDE